MEEEQALNTIKHTKKKIEDVIALLPQDLRDPKSEIKNILKNKLFKYDMKLGGVVLNHKNIKNQDDRALIHDEQPQIYLPVKYNAYILKMQVGDILPGTITQIFQGHIGILIFGVFNAIVHIQDVNQKIFTVNQDQEWVNVKTNEALEIGSEIQFQIKNIKLEESGEFQIEGAIQNGKKTGVISEIKQKYQADVDESMLELINSNMENIME